MISIKAWFDNSTAWLLTFWPYAVVIHGQSCGQPLQQVWRSYAYPFLSYELWRAQLDTIYIAFAATMHVLHHDLCLGDKFFPHIYISLTSVSIYSLCNLYVFTMKISLVIHQNILQPCANSHTTVCACATSHDLWRNNNNNNNNCFMALCPGLPGWAGTRRNTHPPTIVIIIQSLSASSIAWI